MKKCYFCGIKKGLKSIWMEDDDIGEMKNHCSCNKCFFDNELENESEVTKDNWDSYNYHWKLKK